MDGACDKDGASEGACEMDSPPVDCWFVRRTEPLTQTASWKALGTPMKDGREVATTKDDEGDDRVIHEK